MNIVLSRYTNERNALTKAITTVATLSGTLRGECDILKPVVNVEIPEGVSQANIVANCNYAYIEDFGRYYFITGLKGVAQGIIEVTMNVDVLQSWNSQIKAQTCIIARQEKADYSCLHLSDSYIHTYNDPYHVTKMFPAGFTDTTFVLAVAGSST